MTDTTKTEALRLAEAQRLGAQGAPATEEERMLFEAWMKGHCWKVSGEWNGAQYVDPAESDGYPRPQAMLTRQLFAAWRDRGALDSAERDRLAAECEALRACATKYLGWLNVKNPAKSLEQDITNPEMIGGVSKPAAIDAAMGGKESQGGNGSGQGSRS